MVNLTISTLADYLTYYAAFMGGKYHIYDFHKAIISWRQWNYIHFCFLHKYDRIITHHRIRKAKQLLNLNGQNTSKNTKRIM